MGGQIAVANRHPSRGVNTAFVRRLAGRVLRAIGTDGRADIELVFLGDAAIRTLNRRYKSEDRPTDVLSFKMGRAEFGQPAFLGEIFISLDAARRNAALFGTSFAEEVILYVIHGILHLYGYDDTTPAQAKRMSARQAAIMRKVCRKETLSRVLTRR